MSDDFLEVRITAFEPDGTQRINVLTYIPQESFEEEVRAIILSLLASESSILVSFL